MNHKNTKYKEISILDEFKVHLDKMEKCNTSKNQLASRINSIIYEERQKSNKVITLTKIRPIYYKRFKSLISISTASRIMKRHLNLHFRRISIKNSKLNKRNYKIMQVIFLKGVLSNKCRNGHYFY